MPVFIANACFSHSQGSSCMVPVHICHGLPRAPHTRRTTFLVSAELSDACLVLASLPVEALSPSRGILIDVHDRSPSLHGVHVLQHVSHRPVATFFSTALPALIQGQIGSLPFESLSCRTPTHWTRWVCVCRCSCRRNRIWYQS